MENRNLEKALELISDLIQGEENPVLYEEYISNSEVFHLTGLIAEKLNLSIYEYHNHLYLTGGERNRVFGFTNEELKKTIGVRLNRELYLCYYIIYIIMTKFYQDSATYSYIEYVKMEDIIQGVDQGLAAVISQIEVLVLSEIEENSFRTLALMWEDLPMITTEESAVRRAARNSKIGYVKMVLNFMVSQHLLLEAEARYYPTERFRALIENYYTEHQGRLYELLNGKDEA
ncbi:MAG: DUF6063 family protein [Lachnospiraceae bacterium]